MWRRISATSRGIRISPSIFCRRCPPCAVHSTIKAGTGYTTLEFKVNLVRALTVATGEVRAEGRIVHAGQRVATAEGDIRDDGGRILAHATTTCLVFPL